MLLGRWGGRRWGSVALAAAATASRWSDDAGVGCHVDDDIGVVATVAVAVILV